MHFGNNNCESFTLKVSTVDVYRRSAMRMLCYRRIEISESCDGCRSLMHMF